MSELHISRVLTDIRLLQENPVVGVVVTDVDDPTQFDAHITGPEGTGYEGGLFTVGVRISQQFPMKPPVIHFRNPIFHPNIIEFGGFICLDLLDKKWTPSITVGNALEAVHGLLSDPNPYSPMNGQAARMMLDDPEMYTKTVQTWTHHFAFGSSSVAEYEAKITNLVSLGQTVKEAITELTANSWKP